MFPLRASRSIGKHSMDLILGKCTLSRVYNDSLISGLLLLRISYILAHTASACRRARFTSDKVQKRDCETLTVKSSRPQSKYLKHTSFQENIKSDLKSLHKLIIHFRLSNKSQTNIRWTLTQSPWHIQQEITLSHVKVIGRLSKTSNIRLWRLRNSGKRHLLPCYKATHGM